MLVFRFGADVLVPEWTLAGPQRLRCSFDRGEGCAEGHEAPSCAAEHDSFRRVEQFR